MSDTLGKTLAAMRVKKGLSIEEVSAITRINPRLVRLIEDDQYDQLPGEVFIKGLLRSYAGVVGLSGDEVVARFNALGVNMKDRSPVMISVPLRPESRWLGRMVFYILAVLAVVGLVIYYAGYWERQAETVFVSTMDNKKSGKKEVKTVPSDESGKTDTPLEPAPMQGPALASEPKEKTLSPQQPVPAPTVQTPPPAKKPEPKPAQTQRVEEKPLIGHVQSVNKNRHTLSVTASDVSWISVVIDGSVSKQIFLNAGETVSWTGEKGFKLTIGNAVATKVYLDGVEVKIKNAVQNVIKEMSIPVNTHIKQEDAEGQAG
ncbi:MAG: helix-turn-helix domain-containing protein [Nitrospinae bacterium]|nr:helix-turn-helix domain-containing protein [Nitrospinota bacterium]